MTTLASTAAAAAATPDPTSAAWLNASLKNEPREVATAELESMAGAGGLSGELRRLRLTFTNGESATLVVKNTNPGGEASARQLGLAREALFYDQFESLPEAQAGLDIGRLLPRVHFAEGSMADGTKLMILEDLSACVQSGLFFGPGSPLNWGKDLPALTKPLADANLGPAALTTLAFSAAAKVHARFWQAEGLQAVPWLRGAAWIRGEGQDAWRGSQQFAAGAWAGAKAKMGTAEDGVNWDPTLVAVVDASIAKASADASGWETFQAWAQSFPLTLVHGDFHPANMMVRPGGTDLALLDWEVVGVGSGPQDLGQYLISHCDPAIRAEIERPAVEAYHAELTSLNPSVAETLDLDRCFAEMVAGGVGRWMWMLPVLTTMCPPPMVQYFHDQVLAFVTTHGVTPDNVPLPRA